MEASQHFQKRFGSFDNPILTGSSKSNISNANIGSNSSINGGLKTLNKCRICDTLIHKMESHVEYDGHDVHMRCLNHVLWHQFDCGCPCEGLMNLKYDSSSSSINTLFSTPRSIAGLESSSSTTIPQSQQAPLSLFGKSFTLDSSTNDEIHNNNNNNCKITFLDARYTSSSSTSSSQINSINNNLNEDPHNPSYPSLAANAAVAIASKKQLQQQSPLPMNEPFSIDNTYQFVTQLIQPKNITTLRLINSNFILEASRKNQTAILSQFLKIQCDPKVVDVQDEFGRTALIWASQRGHLKSCELLIEYGASLNIQNKFGYTALILASKRGNSKVVELLINCGADGTLINQEGFTAFGVAKSPEIRKMLMRFHVEKQQQQQQPYHHLQQQQQLPMLMSTPLSQQQIQMSLMNKQMNNGYTTTNNTNNIGYNTINGNGNNIGSNIGSGGNMNNNQQQYANEPSYNQFKMMNGNNNNNNVHYNNANANATTISSQYSNSSSINSNGNNMYHNTINTNYSPYSNTNNNNNSTNINMMVPNLYQPSFNHNNHNNNNHINGTGNSNVVIAPHHSPTTMNNHNQPHQLPLSQQQQQQQQNVNTPKPSSSSSSSSSTAYQNPLYQNPSPPLHSLGSQSLPLPVPLQQKAQLSTRQSLYELEVPPPYTVSPSVSSYTNSGSNSVGTASISNGETTVIIDNNNSSSSSSCKSGISGISGSSGYTSNGNTSQYAANTPIDIPNSSKAVYGNGNTATSFTPSNQRMNDTMMQNNFTNVNSSKNDNNNTNTTNGTNIHGYNNGNLMGIHSTSSLLGSNISISPPQTNLDTLLMQNNFTNSSKGNSNNNNTNSFISHNYTNNNSYNNNNNSSISPLRSGRDLYSNYTSGKTSFNSTSTKSNFSASLGAFSPTKHTHYSSDNYLMKDSIFQLELQDSDDGDVAATTTTIGDNDHHHHHQHDDLKLHETLTMNNMNHHQQQLPMSSNYNIDDDDDDYNKLTLNIHNLNILNTSTNDDVDSPIIHPFR